MLSPWLVSKMSKTEESKMLRAERVFLIRIYPKRKAELSEFYFVSLLIKQTAVLKQDPPSKGEVQNSPPNSSGEPRAVSSVPKLHQRGSGPDDEVSFDDPPIVSTSESNSSTSPSGGRFASNTLSYHTNDNESASSKKLIGLKGVSM
jgi:hypothetical protein